MNWSNLLSTERYKVSTRTPTEYDNRNEFESDYGRIIFSPAVRRMHDKTQVFPLTTDDNIHSRLTHSLEVSSIAQSLGLNLIKRGLFNNSKLSEIELFRTIPAILTSVSLCHDIGNPPFGHFGEKVIANYFKKYISDNKELNLSDEEKMDFTEFDGNAQGFRVLTKLQILQDKAGLNLTAGTLASYLKYPILSSEFVNDSEKKYQSKIGVFQSEKEHLYFLREKTKLFKVRHPLVYLMEAADNICYFTMDIEDGFNKKYYSFDQMIDFLKTEGNEEIKNDIDSICAMVNKKAEKGKPNYDSTRIVNFRIFLIQHLVKNAVITYENNFSKIIAGEYDDELLFDKKLSPLADVLQKFQIKYIFCNRDIEKLELTGESVIKGLFDHFVFDLIQYKEKKGENSDRSKKLLNLISQSLKTIVTLETGEENAYNWSDYYKLRLIVDYISGMTDKFALKLYQELQGIRI
jgi:dGTPase